MGQVGCKWGKCAGSSGPSGLQVGQVGQVCRKWAKCAASVSSGLQAATQSSHQKSLPQTVFCVRETAAIFKPSIASCLLAIRLTRVTRFGQRFLAYRLTQSLPQTVFILRETLGKWIQAYTAHLPHLAHSQHTRHTWPTCSTLAPLGPLTAHSTHLAHSQHTRHTWPTCTTLASLDLGRLRQLGREWIECGKYVASGSSVSQVGQVCRKWVKCVASASSASQVGQVRRKRVRCVARASVSSGSSVLQVGQVVAIALLSRHPSKCAKCASTLAISYWFRFARSM